MLAISAGDLALVHFADAPEPASAFHATVELPPRSHLVLRCPRACLSVVPAGGQCRINVAFAVNRLRFVTMHMALDASSLDVLFPEPCGVPDPAPNLAFFDSALLEPQRRWVCLASAR
jgi:hypothetical protein